MEPLDSQFEGMASALSTMGGIAQYVVIAVSVVGIAFYFTIACQNARYKSRQNQGGRQ